MYMNNSCRNTVCNVFHRLSSTSLTITEFTRYALLFLSFKKSPSVYIGIDEVVFTVQGVYTCKSYM